MTQDKPTTSGYHRTGGDTEMSKPDRTYALPAVPRAVSTRPTATDVEHPLWGPFVHAARQAEENAVRAGAARRWRDAATWAYAAHVGWGHAARLAAHVGQQEAAATAHAAEELYGYTFSALTAGSPTVWAVAADGLNRWYAIASGH